MASIMECFRWGHFVHISLLTVQSFSQCINLFLPITKYWIMNINSER
jgi:hypothetical protein